MLNNDQIKNLDDNEAFFRKEVEDHKDELCINLCCEIVKLVGFVDILEDDFYYEVISLDKGKYLESCVMSLFWLKNVIPDKEYNTLYKIFDLNYKGN